METIVFYGIALFIFITGILAVTARHIFRAAIWLLFALMGIAALYFWMDLNFVAAVQIIIYVGGIVVLIIFSIFLTQQSGQKMAQSSLLQYIFSIAAVVFGTAFIGSIIARFYFVESHVVMNTAVENIGAQLMSVQQYGYALPFELVSILLLAAMIGSIVIAMKQKTKIKNS
ncbi:MAG: NADH-quinone oxidoreductase subunit J [Sphingobacteriales bacterium]|uniref:NADH-quinone oxidoreductase subunit J family protein n=1 Tax=Hydrotalea flava TaxID=714549 RepID=UPI00083370BB|nr:NADH-quinone oxidoreductase subunit J [Hydrotalea flava]RTL51526.1 MAG: NADH-quinone oxidoreductase subunit J [Sphingobacteriales bacterium]